MAKLKNLIDLTQSQMTDEELDADILYNINDQPHTSITLEQMSVQQPADGSLYHVGEVFYCRTGAKAGRFVMWTGVDWLDLGRLVKEEDFDALEKIANKVTSVSSSSTNTQYPTALAIYNYAEAKSNKSTTLNASSTTTQYPTSKTVYDNLGLEVEEA